MSNNLLDGIDIQTPSQEKQQYDYSNVINYLLHLSQGRARDTMELELIQAFAQVTQRLLVPAQRLVMAELLKAISETPLTLFIDEKESATFFKEFSHSKTQGKAALIDVLEEVAMVLAAAEVQGVKDYIREVAEHYNVLLHGSMWMTVFYLLATHTHHNFALCVAMKQNNTSNQLMTEG